MVADGEISEKHKDVKSGVPWGIVLAAAAILFIIIYDIDEEIRSSLQERGKQHGTQLQNVLSIKLHSKSWAAFGCQMIFRWSSAEQRTTKRAVSDMGLNCRMF